LANAAFAAVDAEREAEFGHWYYNVASHQVAIGDTLPEFAMRSF
jgi:hypothetical protein